MFEKQIFQYIFSKKQKDLKDLKDPRTYYSLSTARRKKPTSKCIITKMIIQKKMRKERRRRRRARAIFRPLPLAPHPCSGLSRCQIFFTLHFEKWAEGGGTLEIVGKKGDEEWTRRGTRFTSVAGSSSLAGLAPFSEATGEISTITQRGGSKHRPLLSSPPSVAPPPIHKSNNLSGPSAPF